MVRTEKKDNVINIIMIQKKGQLMNEYVSENCKKMIEEIKRKIQEY